MFTEREKSLLQLNYFTPVFCASDVCEIQSKNGDHWIILKVQTHVPKRKMENIRHFDYTYRLYHRHADVEGFHEQSEHIDLLDLVLEVINHDDYRLHRRGKTFFDEVVKMYA